MKYPKSQFDILITHLPTLIKVMELEHLKFDQYNIGTVHDLHFKMYVNLNYPSNNPSVLNKEGRRLVFSGGERLFNIDETFELYPNGCTDDNITTAMQKAIKQILK